MRRETPFGLTPKTTGGAATGEIDFAANVGAPTQLSDPNVIEIQRYEKPLAPTPQPFEVGGTWQIKARFTGTAAATADVLVTVWCYDRTSAQWYAIAAQRFVGVNLLGTVELGNAKDMSAVIGTSHVGFEVEDLATNQTLHIVMYEAK
jgi:hypothetical protein